MITAVIKAVGLVLAVVGVFGVIALAHFYVSILHRR